MTASSEGSRKRDPTLTNLLIGLVATVVLMFGAPFVAGILGWTHAPTGKSWWILVAATVGIIFKMFASETASGEVEFYKLGYDLCTTALGGIITALAIQLPSSSDMFPGLASASFLPKVGESESVNRTAQLVSLFVISLGTVTFTARIARSIHEKRTPPRGFLAAFSSFTGALILCCYALLLACKD